MDDFRTHSYTRDSDNEWEHEFGYPLHDAAFQDNCDEIMELINHHSYDIDGHNTKGETPLFVAAANGKTEVLKLLLDNSADPNISNNGDNITPLLKAVRGGHEDCVQILLQKNADVNLGDVTGWTALHEASYKDYVLILEQLIKIGRADVNPLTEERTTPLFTACQYGNDDCVRMLLYHEADRNIVSIHNDSPLHIACQQGNMVCAELIINDGFDVNCRNDLNMSPLALACRCNQDNCVRLLIDNEAEVMPQEGDDFDESPLHIAAETKESSCITLLLDHPDVDVNVVCNGITPLFSATCVDNVLSCEVLLRAGADPNCKCITDRSIYTPLMMAAKEDYIDTMIELIDGGGDVNLATFTSPLIMAVRSQSMNCLNYLLLSCDVNINYVDISTSTALSDACDAIFRRYGYESPAERSDPANYKVLMHVCQKLLKAGADISWLYGPEFCVLYNPLIGFHPELMELLLQFDGTPCEEVRRIWEINQVAKDWKPLYEIISSPRSLEHLCRVAIRHSLGYKRLKLIGDLPLPQCLKNYLSYGN